MTFEVFKMIVNTLKKRNAPKAHVGFTKRDDGLFPQLCAGLLCRLHEGQNTSM